MGRQLDVVGLGYCSYDTLAIVDEMPAFDNVRGVHLGGLAQAKALSITSPPKNAGQAPPPFR